MIRGQKQDKVPASVAKGTESSHTRVERGESRTDHNSRENFLEKTHSGDNAHRLLDMGGLICSSQNVLS